MPLRERVDLVLNGQFRLGRNLRAVVDERGGLALLFKAGKHVRLSPGYLFIVTQPAAGRTSYENRLTFAATFEIPMGRFILEDRNLFERRLRDPQADATRYRNRLRLDHPLTIRGVRFKVYVADEVFYDWGEDAWVRNRFTVGASRQFTRRLASEVYYFRQNDGHSRPGDLHVIGTQLNLRFGR